MKTFKEILIENSYLDHLKSKPPKINDPKEISDDFGAPEARRQMQVFHQQIFKWDKDKAWDEKDKRWDTQGEPKQNTELRDAYYSHHGLKAPRHSDTEENPREAARFLDHMHHHFPDLARSYNMSPMSTGSNEDALRGRYTRRVSDTLNHIGHIIAPKFMERRRKRKEQEMVDSLSKTITKLKSSGLFKDIEKHEKNETSKFHSNNPDLHHLSGEQVYGHYKSEHKGITVGPVPKKQFVKHWNNITGNK
jgi:hypothetical protein